MKGVDSAHRRNPLPFDFLPAGGRPAFSRCGLLPAPCKPLRLRFGEQNLHTIPAPPLGAGRLFRSAVCSPLPANPCSSVLGSKIFTQFPRRRRVPAAFFRARFAPPSPLGLVLPSGGAKSSHNSRATVGRRSGGPRRPSKNPRSTFCFGDFSFTFIFLYLSISSRWDSGVWK